MSLRGLELDCCLLDLTLQSVLCLLVLCRQPGQVRVALVFCLLLECFQMRASSADQVVGRRQPAYLGGLLDYVLETRNLLLLFLDVLGKGLL